MFGPTRRLLTEIAQLHERRGNDLRLSFHAYARAFKRDAYPEDLLGALVFLASPAAGFITGQTLYVDGGYTAG